MKFYKLVTYVPQTHAGAVRKSLGDAGIGKFEKYTYCSFSVVGTGRFTPLEGASPAIGEVGRPEEVEEECIQTVCPESLIDIAIAAIKSVHPYQQFAVHFTELHEKSLL
ncbi:MAG TPA: hypothetical protein VEA59_03405 [Patescibacteria group bacterium]|nr:hypothetical protein [Patescibacteria group bacterium]